MRPDGVVIVSPERKFAVGIVECIEHLLLQQLVAQAAVERLDKGILMRLSWINVVPRDSALLGPT